MDLVMTMPACSGTVAWPDGAPAATRISTSDRGSPRARLDAIRLGIPLQTERRGRRHVSQQRRGGNDRWAGEKPFAAVPHPVLPVAVERRDRTLAGLERVGP